MKRSNVISSTVAVVQKRPRLNSVGHSEGFVKMDSSFNNITWYYKKNISTILYEDFLDSVYSELLDILESKTQKPFKFNLELEAMYNIPHIIDSSVNRAFKTKAREIFEATNIREVVKNMYEKMLSEEDMYQGKGSGFTLEKIDGIRLTVYKYTPMDGTSDICLPPDIKNKYTPIGGTSYIPLPRDIKNKQAIINPQNNDYLSFEWAIIAKHVTGPCKHRVKNNYFMHEDKYNFTGLNFPTPLKNITIFEKNNDVSVNVYGLKILNNKSQVFPLKVADEVKEQHFDLLLIENDNKNHYTFISDFSRLVRSQKTKHTERVVFCKRCFKSFDNRGKKTNGQAALKEHQEICGDHKPVKAIMPDKNTILEFKNWCNTQRHPILIYADFEALLVKCDENKGENTTAIHRHKPMSYGIQVKASDDVPTELLRKFKIPQSVIIYRGSEKNEKVAEHFLKKVVDIVGKIEKLFKVNTPIIMTTEEQQIHSECSMCSVCKKEFTSSNIKVADHCHLSGKFRQTLCNTCNLKTAYA